jgi:hypothetical protein
MFSASKKIEVNDYITLDSSETKLINTNYFSSPLTIYSYIVSYYIMNLWATNIANLWAIASRISKNKQLAIIILVVCEYARTSSMSK